MKLKTALVLAVVLAAPAARGATVAIDIRNDAFGPNNADVTITAGDTVTWTNHDVANHTVTSGTPADAGKLFDVTLTSGKSTSFTFTTAGTYPYYCRIHLVCCSMKSNIIVNPAVPKKGDANDDGVVNMDDVIAELDWLGGEAPMPDGRLAVVDLYPEGAPDGVFDMRDAARLLRFLAGVDTTPL